MATVLGLGFLLILLIAVVGQMVSGSSWSGSSSSSSSSSSSTDSSSSTSSAYDCAYAVTNSMDRALESFYGLSSPYSSTYRTSYSPGYYPYSYDSSWAERSMMVTVYREGSPEVRAWDANMAEINRWHTSGTYTFDAATTNAVSATWSICNASYS